MSQLPTINGILPTPQAWARVSRTVRVVEGDVGKAQARRRVVSDDQVLRAVYTDEFSDFYKLRIWDGVSANRTAGIVVYAWKPATLRPTTTYLNNLTSLTITGVGAITATDASGSEDWEIRPAIRLNYTDTLLVQAPIIDSALCSANLTTDLSSASITRDKIIYQDLNICGRVWCQKVGT